MPQQEPDDAAVGEPSDRWRADPGATTGTDVECEGWRQEAALRMLDNNLDPDVAERPEDLVVYGGTGRAARSWDAYDAIVAELRELGDTETLLVQSGKPVGRFETHERAPRVLIANSNLVGRWDTWEQFHELEAKGLIMYGQMTAGPWAYTGTQGIVRGTDETLAEADGLPEADPERYERETLETIDRHVDGVLELRERGAVAVEYGNNTRGQGVGFRVERTDGSSEVPWALSGAADRERDADGGPTEDGDDV